MSASSTQFSWTCAACGRQVPNRLQECRCGAGARPTAAPSAPAGPSVAGSWAIIALVACAAAATLIYLQVKPTASSRPDAPVVPPVASATAEAAPSAPDAALQPTAPVAPAGTVPVPSFAPAEHTVATSSERLEDVISRALPATVAIEAGQSRGTGFFAATGTIITNRHVTQGHVAVNVRLSNGQTLPGRVEASSVEHDLAIVRVAAPAGHGILPLGNVSEVRPGQEVVAIGLALGVFQNSVTRGIISAVRQANRTVVLQTDAAINPGNSGGPLLNRQGVVVGVTTLKVSGTAESLGFAVAADHVRALLTGAPAPVPLATSSAPSNQALASAFSAKSSADVAREEGARRYQQIVEAAARRSAEIDGFWARVKANCTVRPAAGYDREWFGLWDGRTVISSPDGSCMSAARDLEQLAGEVRSVMASAGEAARRAAVLPGDLRSVRRRHRMDWPGFD